MFELLTSSINFKKINKLLDQLKKQNLFTLFFEGIVELFKINQACSLAIFVPQKCHFRDSDCNIYYDLPTHTCSIKENMNCLTSYNYFVLYFNYFTIVSFLILYFIEIKREIWLMDHFNYDENLNNNIIEKERVENNKLFNKLINCNRIYFYSYIIISLIFITNFIVSGILVLLLNYFNNFSSITIFITSILLCINKLFNGYYVAYTSYYENKPMSYYAKYNLIYNEIKLEHSKHFIDYIQSFFSNITFDELNNVFAKFNISSKTNIPDDIIIEIKKSNSSTNFINNKTDIPDYIEIKKSNSLTNSQENNTIFIESSNQNSPRTSSKQTHSRKSLNQNSPKKSSIRFSFNQDNNNNSSNINEQLIIEALTRLNSTEKTIDQNKSTPVVHDNMKIFNSSEQSESIPVVNDNMKIFKSRNNSIENTKIGSLYNNLFGNKNNSRHNSIFESKNNSRHDSIPGSKNNSRHNSIIESENELSNLELGNIEISSNINTLPRIKNVNEAATKRASLLIQINENTNSIIIKTPTDNKKINFNEISDLIEQYKNTNA
jgi:hypothetical protein